MRYFSKFPKMFYDVEGNGNEKLIPDIFRRIKIKDKIRDNISLLDKYDVQDNEKPEDVAYKVYGSPEYYWVVLMTNKIQNRYFEWPLSNLAFEGYMNAKYDNPNGIHHYEKPQTSGRTTSNGPGDFDYLIECNSDDPLGGPVTNYEYEQRLQDSRRQIMLLQPNFLQAFVKEFERLARQ